MKKIVIDSKERIIGVADESKKDGRFIIPVADVRRNRGQVERIEKYANIEKGSKFFKPSYSLLGYSYNISMKNV